MTRESLAEGLGTSLLLYVIVGSGIAAERLASDPGLGLLAHALVVGLALGALIALMLPVSGAHFNPSVTLALWRVGLIDMAGTVRYVTSQTCGAIVGVLAANRTFNEAALSVCPPRLEVGQGWSSPRQ
jgi:glycerol uptake facilitator-like aquaporin